MQPVAKGAEHVWRTAETACVASASTLQAVQTTPNEVKTEGKRKENTHTRQTWETVLRLDWRSSFLSSSCSDNSEMGVATRPLLVLS